jgi:two-component system NarL family response regulator
MILVDDSDLFLSGLRNMLEAADIVVLGTASSAQEAIELARRLQPEVVLMDVQMPGQNGIEATRVLKALFPEMKIVMMTVSDRDEHLFDAIVAGVSGYLLKNMSPEKFLETLTGIERGESPLSPGLAARIMAEFARRDRETAPRNAGIESSLSERQQEILSLVAQGWTYKAIAQTLNLTEAGIKYHMGEITRRMHLQNRSQAIARANRLPPNLSAEKQCP